MSLLERFDSTDIHNLDAALIIPAKDEAADLRIDAFKRALDSNMELFSREFPNDYQRRMIVIDDGSTDNTAEIARSFDYEVISHKANQGKGAAIRTGVIAIIGSLDNPNLEDLSVAFTDADGSYSAETILDLIGMTKNGSDFAVAKRYELGKSKKMVRGLAHTAIQQCIKLLLPTGVTDSQAGAMAFGGEAFRLWQQSKIDSYLTPTEVLYRANKMGLKTVELDAEITSVEGSHVRFSDGFKLAKDAIKVKLASK